MEKQTLKSEDIVSVVIPAYNAERTILSALRALENQTLDKGLYEVIVVDDGSNDGTRKIVEDFVEKGTMRLSYDYKENEGVGRATNLWISRSVWKTLAFTDSDCIPDSDWLEVVYRSIVTEGKRFIGGYTYSDDTVIFPWKMAPVGQSGITANMAVDFTVITGTLFDAGFAGMLGNDTDFVLRMESDGFVQEYVPEMRVLHPPNVIGADRIVIRSRGRRNEVGLYKRHGKKVLNSFSPVFRPIIFSRISPFTVLVAVGIADICATYSFFGFWAVFGISVLFFVLFYAYLHRFCVIYNPDGRDISFKDRSKTLFYLFLITPLFFYYRVVGMCRFKYFLL